MEDVEESSSSVVETAINEPSSTVFRRLYEKAASGDEDSMSLIPVIGAIREMLDQQRLEGFDSTQEPSPTEYFAAIFSALDGTDQSHVPQLLVLLATVLPDANKALLRAKFSPIFATLLRIMVECEASEGEKSTIIGPLASAMQCLGCLLAAQDLTVWSKPAAVKALGAILKYFSDTSAKLRKPAHAAVVTVLSAESTTLRNNPQLAAKAGSIKRCGKLVMDFCFAVLEGVTSQDVNRAMYLLIFLRSAAPLMPPEDCTAICLAMMKLPSLGSPTLTAAVMQCVSGIVQSPVSSCLPPAALSEIITRMLEVYPNSSDGAGATAFAQALASSMVRLSMHENGAEKARALLPESCLALVSYCESHIAGLHTAACASLNLMFQTIVDQSMITEMAESMGTKKVKTYKHALLEKVLCGFESLLQYRYQRAWPKVLPLLGRLFIHIGKPSYPILASTLKSLGDLHDALASLPSASSMPGVLPALNGALGLAIEGMGIEHVLTVLPLRPEGTDDMTGVKDSRAWLIPLLVEHGKVFPNRLAFFHTDIVELAKHCDRVARSGKLTANEAHTQMMRVTQLWGLLPPMCVDAVDIAESFGKLAPVLANAMQDERYPGILPKVCTGITALVATAKASGASPASNPALQLLANTSKKFLPIIFTLVEKLAKTHMYSGGEAEKALCTVCGALSSIAPAAFLSHLFKRLLQKLLEATAGLENMDNKVAVDRGADAMDTVVDEERGNIPEAALLPMAYMAIAQALVPSLDEECTGLLYRSSKPLIRDGTSPAVQKRAYRLLLALCASQGSWLVHEERLPDVIELFVSSLATCHVTARQCRLRCMTLLVQSFTPGDPTQSSAVMSVIGEVVLSTKDSNGRTRECAYELLIALATKACSDPSDLVKAVVGCLGAKTTHMRSAGVLALSRLQYEFGHFRSEAWQLSVAQMTPQLITTMLILAKEPSREVTKAVLGFLRVAVGGADRGVLEPLIPTIVKGVMCDIPRDNRLYQRAKVKVVLSKLCRKFGFDRIKAEMPEDDKKLVTAMQKVAEKELKAKADLQSKRATRGGDSGAGKSGTHHQSKFDSMMHDSDNDASDSEDEHPARGKDTKIAKKKGNKERGGGGGIMVREKGDDIGDAVDLLDGSMVRNMKIVGNKGSDEESDTDMEGDDVEVHVGTDGKLIIPDDSDDSDESEELEMEYEPKQKKLLSTKGPNSKRKRADIDPDDSDEDASNKQKQAANKRKAVTDNTGRKPAPRTVSGGEGAGKLSKHGTRDVKTIAGSHMGSEYKAKRGGGDVKRKGQTLEPYAYIPLDAKALLATKKSGGRSKALEAYGKVVYKDKKGYQKRTGNKK